VSGARSVALAPALPAAAAGPVWIRVGALLDGSGGPPQRDAHIVYEPEQILHVGGAPPRALVRPGCDAPDAELRDHTALPGLIEAHGHLVLEGAELDLESRKGHLKRPAEELLAAARGRARRLPRLGIVAMRDAGDRHGVGLALGREATGGAPEPLPYLESPGPVVHRRGCYGAFIGKGLGPGDGVEACVEERARAGARRIKLMVSGIIDFERGAVTRPPQLSAADVQAITAAARRRGLPVFAHASGAAGIANAIAAQVESVEHGFFVTPEQLARMRDAGIAWVPTFSPVRQQLDHADTMAWSAATRDQLRRILDGHAESLRRAAALGVRVLAGSDAGSYGVAHGRGLLEELSLMESAGLPSGAVISAATGASAAHLGWQGLGRLARGARARFVLAARSPLETVAHLAGERLCVFDGALLPRDDGTRGL
jgi:imidazolonepropionase-like amidohydrolase